MPKKPQISEIVSMLTFNKYHNFRDSMKTNEEVGKEVLAELRERAQQPESDKVTAHRQHFFGSSPKLSSEERNSSKL